MSIFPTWRWRSEASTLYERFKDAKMTDETKPSNAVLEKRLSVYEAGLSAAALRRGYKAVVAEYCVEVLTEEDQRAGLEHLRTVYGASSLAPTFWPVSGKPYLLVLRNRIRAWPGQVPLLRPRAWVGRLRLVLLGSLYQEPRVEGGLL